MIRLMFGTNAPRLVNIITEELKKQEQAMAQGIPRDGINFDQLTDEEQERVDAENQVAAEAAKIEAEAARKEKEQRRMIIVENLAPNLKEFNMVVLFPKVTFEQTLMVQDAFKLSGNFTSFGKPAKKFMTKEEFNEMSYFSDWLLDEAAINEITDGECTGMLYQCSAEADQEQIIELMANVVYGDNKPPGIEDCLAYALQYKIEKELSVAVEEAEVQEGDLTIQNVSQSLSNIEKLEGSKSKTEIVVEPLDEPIIDEVVTNEYIQIPGIWIPSNERTKTLALRHFFPNVTGKFDLPEPEHVPPHLLISFDAFKKKEVLELAAEYPEETMKIGFFTSHELDTAQLIAKTPESFEKITVPPFGAKLVIQVSKKLSEPLLSYALLGPTYVSPNTVVGEKECAQFFPDGYEVVEAVEEEEKPSKRKRKKKSSTSKTEMSVTSTSDFLDEMTEEKIDEMEELEMGEMEEVEYADLPEDGLEENLDFLVPPSNIIPPEETIVQTVAEEADKATSPMEQAGEEQAQEEQIGEEQVGEE